MGLQAITMSATQEKWLVLNGRGNGTRDGTGDDKDDDLRLVAVISDATHR